MSIVGAVSALKVDPVPCVADDVVKARVSLPELSDCSLCKLRTALAIGKNKSFDQIIFK